ncbi:BSD domain-containing protein 1-like [Panicum miliaceum]|uniref:BSD domain-containing protein 1-like n=1 Tax=Panicum miliaceum TaxID=4540 RepID=A0A3L6SSU5_PANMI|nr:BSD domain-containing protein 1-like [Panicum miliaceum]
MNFFSSVFSAPAEEEGEGQREGEEQEGKQEPAAEQSGGGWIFGGLIDTLKEEIEEQRRVNESAAAEEEQEKDEAQRGAEGEAGSGGGWIFGGLIKTLAEEIEAQRKEQEAIAAAAEAGEGERERGAEADAAATPADEEGEGSGGGWSFGGLIKTLAEEIEAQRNEQGSAAEAADGEEGPDGGWSFEGLVKTFASRSETVLGGYRRDLQDLGSGLRLETAALRAAAARAASALPGALEAGASAASDRLESVGQAVDDLGAAAAGLLSHANEALRSAEADGEDGDGAPRASDASASGASWRASLPSKKYTRFEAQVLALRADPATFTEEPEDSEGFARWNSSFSIDEMREQIEGVLRESPGLESFVERLVPSVVDYDTFWSRYFFAVDKLRQAEDVRTKLVNRAMSKEEDEELSWDVDDDDEETNSSDHKEGTNSMVDKKEEQTAEPVNHETEGSGKQEAAVENDSTKDKEVALAAAKDGSVESSVETLTPKSNDGAGQEEKTEAGDSSKESDFSVVSRPSVQEEDLSWEEIEDVGDQDEKKGASPQSSSTNKVEDLRRRLTSMEDDDEDLSWDVDE